MANYYMGVDPGPSTGIALLNIVDLEYGWSVFQVDGWSAGWLIDEICRAYAPRVVAYEEFVPSNRAGTKGKNAQMTRMIADSIPIRVPANSRRTPKTFVVARRATDIKPWATDNRLTKTDFPWGPKFRDARDAGRHALFAAVRDGKERDPLA